MYDIHLLKDLSRSYRKQMEAEADRERLAHFSRQSVDDNEFRPFFWLYLAELLIAVGAVIILRF